MCNLSWTPYSNLEKDNSLKTTPVLAQTWAVWSILTKNVTRAAWSAARVRLIIKLMISIKKIVINILPTVIYLTFHLYMTEKQLEK